MDGLSLSSASTPPKQPSTGSSGLVVNRSRPRAQTVQLECPTPESSPDKYTKSRVRAGIEFAECRLRSTTRKASPILEKMLIVYNAACKAYLTHEDNLDPDEQNKLLLEIRGYETDLSNKNWMQVAGSDAAQKLQDELITLRHMQYYARYGDYAKRLVHQVRVETAKRQTARWQDISGLYQWSEISQKIKDESTWWQAHGSTKGVNNIETTYAIFTGCCTIGIDFDQTIRAIHTYGARNSMVHNLIDTMVISGNFPGVAKTIHRDLNDLASLMPIDMIGEEEFMRATLEELRDTWFDASLDLDNPLVWTATPALKQEYVTNKSQSTSIKLKARDTHEEGVARGAARRIEKLETEAQLVSQLEASLKTPMPLNALPAPGPFTPTSPSKAKSKKRKASQELSYSDARKKAWTSVSEQQMRSISSFRVSLAAQREVNRIVSHYKETFGTSPPSSPSHA